jgi:lipoprotein-releasing system permease protein
VNGFQQATQEKLKSIHADLIINAADYPLDLDLMKQFVIKHPDTICSWSVQKNAHALITGIKKSHELPQAIMIKGVDHRKEGKTSRLESMIIMSAHSGTDLEQLLAGKSIVLGHELAHALGVTVGALITLYFAYDQPHGHTLALDTAHARVTGIFKTGIDEFDAAMAYISLDFFDELFDQELTTATIKLTPGITPESVINKWQEQLPYTLLSWKELYPALASALILEKYATIILLVVIMLVASMTIIALIFMLISSKKNDIAILRSMGCTTGTIRCIFLAISCCITVPAVLTGLATASIVGLILKYYVPIDLPDAYYTAHLPVDLNPYFFCAVGFVIFFVSVIAACIPLLSIAPKNLSPILRSSC